jgi:hypothetical protein
MSCAAGRLTTIESDCSSARKKALRRARGHCVTARDARAGDLKPADFGSNERAVPIRLQMKAQSLRQGDRRPNGTPQTLPSSPTVPSLAKVACGAAVSRTPKIKMPDNSEARNRRGLGFSHVGAPAP